jgi:hypothetical protein
MQTILDFATSHPAAVVSMSIAAIYAVFHVAFVRRAKAEKKSEDKAQAPAQGKAPAPTPAAAAVPKPAAPNTSPRDVFERVERAEAVLLAALDASVKNALRETMTPENVLRLVEVIESAMPRLAETGKFIPVVAEVVRDLEAALSAARPECTSLRATPDEPPVGKSF